MDVTQSIEPSAAHADTDAWLLDTGYNLDIGRRENTKDLSNSSEHHCLLKSLSISDRLWDDSVSSMLRR